MKHEQELALSTLLRAAHLVAIGRIDLALPAAQSAVVLIEIMTKEVKREAS